MLGVGETFPWQQSHLASWPGMGFVTSQWNLLAGLPGEKAVRGGFDLPSSSLRMRLLRVSLSVFGAAANSSRLYVVSALEHEQPSMWAILC